MGRDISLKPFKLSEVTLLLISFEGLISLLLVFFEGLIFFLPGFLDHLNFDFSINKAFVLLNILFL